MAHWFAETFASAVRCCMRMRPRGSTTNTTATLRSTGPSVTPASSLIVTRLPRQERQTDLARRVVAVRVDQAEGLPGAQREAPAQDRYQQKRRHERGQDVVAPVPGRAVAVPPAVVGRQQLVERAQQVAVTPRTRLDDREAGRRVRDEDVQQPVAPVVDEPGRVGREIVNDRSRSRPDRY